MARSVFVVAVALAVLTAICNAGDSRWHDVSASLPNGVCDKYECTAWRDKNGHMEYGDSADGDGECARIRCAHEYRVGASSSKGPYVGVYPLGIGNLLLGGKRGKGGKIRAPHYLPFMQEVLKGGDGVKLDDHGVPVAVMHGDLQRPLWGKINLPKLMS